MPYASIAEIPDAVGGSKKRRRTWLHVFNSEFKSRQAAGDSAKEAERRAFAAAWAAVKDVKAAEAALRKAVGTKQTGFTRAINGPFHCANCEFFKNASAGCAECHEPEVNADPQLEHEARSTDDFLIVEAGDCCNEFEPVRREKAMRSAFSKFIPFAKVDAQKREVWGIVTAELPDKDDEVCDYEGSKPYYQAVIDEMSKATGGQNLFPLREMHGLSAAGKCVGVEFRDPEREIFMGFKVVDDDAWQKVDENVYTGFSHGGSVVGKMTPDPTFDGCLRYVANPSEVSLVDNPCLAAAHFAYVNKTGQVELRKFSKTGTVDPAVADDVTQLKRQVAELERKLLAKVRTKRVDGEDLPASAFLIVLDPNKTDTWNLPVKFSTEAKSKRHVRNALSRFDQLKDVPKAEKDKAEKDKAWKKLLALCEKYGIDADEEKKVMRMVQSRLRQLARANVNKLARSAPGGNVGLMLATLDNDLGRLHKGMSEVSRLAELIQYLGFLVYDSISEQRWEGDDDSPLPALLEQDCANLLDTLLRMVEEESEEMRESIANFKQSSE